MRALTVFRQIAYEQQEIQAVPPDPAAPTMREQNSQAREPQGTVLWDFSSLPHRRCTAFWAVPAITSSEGELLDAHFWPPGSPAGSAGLAPHEGSSDGNRPVELGLSVFCLMPRAAPASPQLPHRIRVLLQSVPQPQAQRAGGCSECQALLWKWK